MYGKTLADFPGRFELFRDALAELSDAQMEFAFKRAIKTLTDFPVPAQLLAFAKDYQTPEQFRALPSGPVDKPPGWVPLSRDEIQQIIESSRVKLQELEARRKC